MSLSEKLNPLSTWGVVDRQGGRDRDVKSRNGKTTAAFTILKNIWASDDMLITIKSYCIEQIHGERPI